ncbi:hypothetical protein L3X38_017173 [Prunus dulcis]|uniref:Uncharacterized protein n=1 Tax=Prunus dulcis TaxID=3755 RepID=A0AAD4W8M3_PRUDU|nr:hypothetical protein L3X38_017173 [Prunus dulcis]
MEESVWIRKAAELFELIRLVKALKKELCRKVVVELPRPLKLKITNEIAERLKILRPKANVTDQRGQWCKEKLKEAKQLALETEASNSRVSHEEAEDQILPGGLPPPECHAEVHTDYDESLN